MCPRRSTTWGSAGPDGPPDTQQVDLDHPLELLVADHRHRPRRRGDAGVRDRDVEAAEALHDLGDGALEHRPVGDVAADRHRPRPDRVAGGLRIVEVEVEDRHRGAARVQELRGLESDPARRAGDQRDLAVDRIGDRHRVILLRD